MFLRISAVLAFVLCMAAIFIYAPEERAQGVVQKIFYIHVPSAISMYLGFFVAFVAAGMHLWDKKKVWDTISHAAVEVGFLFCCIVLTTGPLWAKPIWGVYWDWEPRLTTTFLVFLLYAAYLVLRQYLSGQRQESKIAAIIALIAFLDVPLIHFSVKLWRGAHPSVIAQEGGLPPTMKSIFLLALFCHFIIFSYLLKERFALKQLQAKMKRGF